MLLMLVLVLILLMLATCSSLTHYFFEHLLVQERINYSVTIPKTCHYFNYRYHKVTNNSLSLYRPKHNSFRLR